MIIGGEPQIVLFFRYNFVNYFSVSDPTLVLFFPDDGIPCQDFYNSRAGCPRDNCPFLHEVFGDCHGSKPFVHWHVIFIFP